MSVDDKKDGLSELPERVNSLIRSVDERFAQVDARFAQVDARFDRVDARFDQLEKRLLEDGRDTRRHMDVLYEHFKADLKLALEQSASAKSDLGSPSAVNAAEHAGFVKSLDDHEVRLQSLERHTR